MTVGGCLCGLWAQGWERFDKVFLSNLEIAFLILITSRCQIVPFLLRCQIVLVPNCPLFIAVPKCLRRQIVLFYIAVPNCPLCQIVLHMIQTKAGKDYRRPPVSVWLRSRASRGSATGSVVPPAIHVEPANQCHPAQLATKHLVQL